MIRSGFISILVPIPLHSGHAPWGALKENILGVNSWKLIPQSVHAKSSEYVFSYSMSSPSSFLLLNITVTRPSAKLQAVSTESDSLLWKSIPSLITSLSTIKSMLCLKVFASSISSSSSRISPSIRALTNPFFLKSSNMSLCSPFLSLITGAITWIFSPSPSSIIDSVICPMVWWETSFPQFGQCGIPILAYNKRK